MHLIICRNLFSTSIFVNHKFTRIYFKPREKIKLELLKHERELDLTSLIFINNAYLPHVVFVTINTSDVKVILMCSNNY